MCLGAWPESAGRRRQSPRWRDGRHLVFSEHYVYRNPPVLHQRGTEINIGFGLMLGGSYEDIDFLKRPGQPPLHLRPETSFGGFALELLVGRKLSRHFGITFTPPPGIRHSAGSATSWLPRR